MLSTSEDVSFIGHKKLKKQAEEVHLFKVLQAYKLIDHSGPTYFYTMLVFFPNVLDLNIAC